MKTLFRLVALCAGIAMPLAAGAQNYPAKPILMVVPLQAASAVDVMMRVAAQKMSENLGQQIVIENQAGAAGLIGAERVTRAAPDGYTIAGISDSVLTMVPHMHRKIGFDPVTGFEPVGMVAAITWVLIAHPSLPAKNVREFVNLAKASPGKLDFSSGGLGSPQHMAMEMFSSAAGIQLTHVPYRGATQAALDVVGGRIPVMFTALSIVLQHIREGKVRALAVAGRQRSPLLPEVPTVSEAGLPGFTFYTWAGIYAPLGTPRPVVERLNAEIAKAVSDPAVREKLSGLGLEPASGTPAQLAEETRSGYARMGKAIRDANIKPE